MEELYDDVEDISFTCPITHVSDREWERERKAARFFVKARIGTLVGVAKGKRFRWWTLTESNESIEAGLSFSHNWAKLRKKLARIDDMLEFCIVEHVQGDRARRNWHVLTYGTNKLPVDELREYWIANFLSTITGLQEVKYPLRSIGYLAGYLGGDDKFQRARFSQDWVFPYWWEFGRFYKKETGLYVPDNELVRLALIPLEERRATNVWFDIFLDVRKIGWSGLIREVNEKWRAILRKGDKKRKFESKSDLHNSNNDQQLEFLVEKAGFSNDRSE